MPPPEMNSPPPPAATGFSALHPDIIMSNILTRLDGPSLSAAACCTTTLRRHSSPENLWSNICHSTWPSTTTPRVSQVISAFPGGGPRAFFSHAFPLLSQSPLSLRHSSSLPPPPELLSAVDIHYHGKLIFTKLHEIETQTEWLLCSPFRIDLLEPKDVVPTTLNYTAGTEILAGMTLSWILIDPIGRRAANLSSHKPVTVQRHWLTGELQARFASILSADGGCGGGVQCGIVVTCGGSEGGEMQVREVRLEIEDMDGRHLNGKESLVILQGALEGKKGTGKNRVEEAQRRYGEYVEMKRERRERKLRKEGALDLLWVVFGVLIYFVFWSYFLCR